MSAHTDRYESAVTRYFEAWNSREPEDLSKAVAVTWAEDGTYTDPLSYVGGHAEIAAVITAAHEQFPGFAFRLAGPVDGHHDTARFAWELVNEADGSAPVAGSDVITLDGDGRIKTVLGFLDRVPTGA
ncbi:nuclear transport factor 2 family protein [Streptomyces sp. NPDC056479]|uniref:nuclear transport factor 2 family protein n=1 Tax=Streptomyces sp. NPDC056479 TaxID=3345832 RepID=UPI003684DCC2